MLKPIVWNATLDLAFKELKDLVCKAPSLLLPDPSKPFEVETDASDYAIGAVLYQDGKPCCMPGRTSLNTGVYPTLLQRGGKDWTLGYTCKMITIRTNGKTIERQG